VIRVLALALSVLPLIAFGQYPAKPIRMIVTYPPGGGADAMARLVAPRMSEGLGQPVVVENRPGASGTIGAEIVARAPADGYTLLFDASAHGVNPSLYPKLPYDPRSAFAAVSLVVLFPNVLVVNPAFQAKSVEEFVALVRAQPGKVAYASSGSGSAQHLAAVLFCQGARLDMIHVPYKGGGPALTDVIGGQVPVYFANMASGLPHVKAGRLRALGVTGTKRSAAAPELPALAETVPGYEVYEWNAVFAPAGTPAVILERLHGELVKALAVKESRERIDALGGEIAALPPAETAQWVRAQMDKWAGVVRAAGIKLD
jgi:tripartite-type tricarboxylate transporter receptor subunit TctC